MGDDFTRSLFDQVQETAGDLACGLEIAATMADALARAARQGLTRQNVVERMAFHAGERISEHVLNGYTAASHPQHEISLRRAMCFDAALGEDCLLGLYARKRGDRRVITTEEAAYLELGRIQQQKRETAERERALQLLLKRR